MTLAGSYTPSDAPVQIERGHSAAPVADAELWPAGLRDDNCFTARCGQTWLLIAPERGGAQGQWQVVHDHVETWGEALALWRRMQAIPNFDVIRALPGERLRDLPVVALTAAKAALSREGWTLGVGDEWILRRAKDGE